MVGKRRIICVSCRSIQFVRLRCHNNVRNFIGVKPIDHHIVVLGGTDFQIDQLENGLHGSRFQVIVGQTCPNFAGICGTARITVSGEVNEIKLFVNLIKIDGNRLGIGTNMFSGEQTLVERDCISVVNSELSERSQFYNNNILVKRKVD